MSVERMKIYEELVKIFVYHDQYSFITCIPIQLNNLHWRTYVSVSWFIVGLVMACSALGAKPIT